MADQSNVVKEKSVNTHCVSDSYTKKYGGGKFKGDSTQGTGYQRTDDPMEEC